MNKEPIVITAAKKSELEYLISVLKNLKKVQYGNYVAYKGKIDDYPIILLITNIGLINAAVSITLLLSKKVKCVINQGTAGAHISTLKINDIVIGKECININSYKTEKLYQGIIPKYWQILSFIADKKDEQIVYKADEKLIEIANNVNNKLGTKILGRLGSGDVWNREKERIELISEKCKTLSEDMESVAIYKVCNDMNVPVIGIRIISNNEITDLEFDKTTETNCQIFVYEMIKKIIKEEINNKF